MNPIKDNVDAQKKTELQGLGSGESVLQTFLNAKHLDFRRLQKYADDFDCAIPFKFLELRDFFVLPKAVALKREVVGLDFDLKKSDLFEFFQSSDLTLRKEGTIAEFIALLQSSAFRAYLMTITGIDLSQSEITLFASRYEDTHYLLPHDDQLEGRQIAFLFYLTEMNEGHGGELVLYDHSDAPSATIDDSGNIVVPKERIRVRFNSFVFFEVSPKSIHAVSEIIGSGERYTLGGWFVLKGSQRGGDYL